MRLREVAESPPRMHAVSAAACRSSPQFCQGWRHSFRSVRARAFKVFGGLFDRRLLDQILDQKREEVQESFREVWGSFGHGLAGRPLGASLFGEVYRLRGRSARRSRSIKSDF